MERMPEEMRKEIKGELAEVTAIILMKEPTKELSSFEGDNAEPDMPQKIHGPHRDSKPVLNTNFEENMIGHVSMKTREMAGSAIERIAGKNASSQYDELMYSQVKKAVNEPLPKGKYYEPQFAAIAAAAVKRMCPVTSSAFPELFELSYEWIYDSGASRHFCGQGNAKQFINLIKKVKAISVATADGICEANKGITMQIDRLGGMLADVLLLPDSPALLSAGALEEQGFSSYGHMDTCHA